MPIAVAAEHPTALQRRLIAELSELMRVNGKRPRDLTAATGIGKSYVSLMLAGKRPGTIAAWDALLRVARTWSTQFAPIPLTAGYDPNAKIDVADLISGDDEPPEPPDDRGRLVALPPATRPPVVRPSSSIRPASKGFR